MELRRYWKIVTARWWLVLGLPLLVAASYPWLRPASAPLYAAGMRFVVGVRPEASGGDYYTYDRYYTWLTAEYLVDDLSEVVKSQRFAQDVGARAGLSVPAGAIQGATSAGKLHRILQVSITWPDPDELARLAAAVQEVLTADASVYFGQLGTEAAVVELIDPAGVYQVGRSLRDRLDLPLRLLLALGAGLALAFLAHYLDDTVRDPDDLRALGLPLVGQVPASPRFLGRFGRRRITW